MNYLTQLTENEVHYICSVIPLHDSIYYFQKNPKEFAKIMPGFRAKSMKSQEQVCTLLLRCRNHYFISSFLEEHIDNWISQIQEHVAKMMDDGDSKELALLHTLPFSFFADNIGLFFKLNNEKCSEEYITLLSAAVNVIKGSSVQQNKLQEELELKESEMGKLQSKLDSTESDLDEEGVKLDQSHTKIKELKCKLTDVEQLRSTIQNDEKMVMALKSKILLEEGTINDLRNEVAEIKNTNQLLETQIRSGQEKQRIAKELERKAAQKPKCPRNLEEFKEYLGYNLENIGLPTNCDYFVLLKEHLSKILFQGIPIILNRGVGIILIKCIANSLIGQLNVKMITYNNNTLIEDIDSSISSDERIVCLDNFIGNYNETKLLPLFNKHRNKIIILTVAYDRTIRYVSREFLRYCQYLNLNRITALATNVELTEDPSTVEEVESEFQEVFKENRYASLLREILNEFDFPKGLIEQKCTAIFNEQDLCRILAFDVLPYCSDVLQIAPYNVSERLNRYAGDSGRCPYKTLFQRWFAK